MIFCYTKMKLKFMNCHMAEQRQSCSQWQLSPAHAIHIISPFHAPLAKGASFMLWIFIKIFILNILHGCIHLELWKPNRNSSLWDNYTLFKTMVCGLNKHLFTRPVKQLQITWLQMEASIFRNSCTKPILSILFCQMSKFILSNFDFYLVIESQKYVGRIITF